MRRASHNSEKYAAALLSMAEAAGRLNGIESDLKNISDAVTENPQLLAFLADNLIRNEGKQEALSEIFSGKADPILVMFLRILQIEDEISHIAEVSRLYSDLVAAKQHRVSGEIVSACPLPEEKINEIEEQTSKILNKEVSLTQIVEPEMLGGIIVRVGNFVIDGSVERELARARATLSS